MKVCTIFRLVFIYNAVTICVLGYRTRSQKCYFDNPTGRIAGGPYGISREDCEGRGNCYSTETTAAIWCFKPQRSADPGCLFVFPHLRVEDGWEGISKESCEARGSCYDETQPGVKHCFLKQPISYVLEHLEDTWKAVSQRTGDSSEDEEDGTALKLMELTVRNEELQTKFELLESKIVHLEGLVKKLMDVRWPSDTTELTNEILAGGYTVRHMNVQKHPDVPYGFISAPGCPRSILGYPWVKYGNPSRCYLVGHKGACNDGMKMGFRSSGNLDGYCKCHACDDHPTQSHPPYCHAFVNYTELASKSFAYHQGTDSCYELYTRGPCGEKELFIVNSLDHATCSPWQPTNEDNCLPPGNSCSLESSSYEYLRPGKCYFSKGNGPHPTCHRVPQPPEEQLIGSTNTSQCSYPAEVYSPNLKRCLVPLIMPRAD